MSKLSNALNKMSAFVLTLSILFCFPLCSGTSNCSALERASSKSIKSEKELEKYSDMSVFKKLFKINESSDGKWRYVFNDDGKDTITLVQAKSETPCELNSTIDGYKITRVSDMFSHIKTIKDYHWGAKKDLFVDSSFLVLLTICSFGLLLPIVCMSREHTWDLERKAKTTYKDIYSNITSINLEHCTVIGEGSFANCKNLKKVNLPNCKSIGKCCFKNCENLSDVIMPKVEKIPQEAFADCKNLKNIIIPNCKVKEKDCFKGCESLDKANTPKAKVA